VRILFTTTARLGHFHPLVPLARAAVSAGHEVAFACAQSLCAAVEASGFRVFPMVDDTLSDPGLTSALERIGRIPSSAPRAAAYLMEVFVGIEARRMLPKLLELSRSWMPDLVVREEYEFGGAIIAERLAIPHAVVQVTHAANWQQQASLFGNVVARAFDELRASVGLAPDEKLEMLYRHLLLSFDPPSLIDPNVTLPKNTHHLRGESFDRSSDDDAPRWLTSNAKRPIVYASLGTIAPTIPSIYPQVYQTMLEGLRDLSGSLLMTIGHESDPGVFGVQPAHVHLERYVPQSAFLDRCDVIVTHGGHNTVLAALAKGVPMIVVPFFADQADNAARVAAIGAGRVIPGRDLSANALREAVRDVLENESYHLAAARVKAEIQTLPGLETGVKLLEELTAQTTRSPRVVAV
jgi:MGT family glycosyltransferase